MHIDTHTKLVNPSPCLPHLTTLYSYLAILPHLAINVFPFALIQLYLHVCVCTSIHVHNAHCLMFCTHTQKAKLEASSDHISSSTEHSSLPLSPSSSSHHAVPPSLSYLYTVSSGADLSMSQFAKQHFRQGEERLRYILQYSYTSNHNHY